MSQDRKWVIHNGSGLYWSDMIGWVLLAIANKYSHREHGNIALPMGGRWKELKHDQDLLQV